MSDGQIDKAAMRRRKIEAYLETHPYIMNANVREILNVSAATANRVLASLVEEGEIVKCRIEGHWGYRKPD